MPIWHQPPEHCNHVLRRNAPASFVACSEISHSSHGAPGEMKLSSRHGGAMPKSRLNTEMTKFSADRAAGDGGNRPIRTGTSSTNDGWKKNGPYER